MSIILHDQIPPSVVLNILCLNLPGKNQAFVRVILPGAIWARPGEEDPAFLHSGFQFSVKIATRNFRILADLSDSVKAFI